MRVASAGSGTFSSSLSVTANGNIYLCRWSVGATTSSSRGWATTVHVYKKGNLVVRWDLDHWRPMKGQGTARIERLLSDLVEEGQQ